MDAKDGTYSDTPYNLEKGCPAPQSLHTDACPTYSAQPERSHGRRSIFKRHWIALGTVALTWLLFSYGRRAFNDRPAHVWRWADDKVGYPPPADGDVDECVGSTNWTSYYDQPPWSPEYPHGAETAFSLPLDSDALYLISRGAFQQGVVNIEQSTQVADTVDVRVRVAYHDGQVLERATVCRMERADREYGVGIFTPWRAPRPRHGRRNGLEFDVTLTLPAGNEGPLSVKKLVTRLPNYSQNVADLKESVLFDNISLTSANGRVSVQSVISEVGQFSSLNGEINGNFNVRSSLDLHTANGRISPTVNLLHREGGDPSNFTIRTINGQIDAKISLTSEASTGGEFEVAADSIHGEIELKFTDTPVDSVLRCQAGTIAGGVRVELDTAFEGTYSLQSMLGKKLVSQRDAEDPAGKGRHRVVSLNETRGRAEGEIKWVEPESHESSSGDGYVILKALTPSVELVI